LLRFNKLTNVKRQKEVKFCHLHPMAVFQNFFNRFIWETRSVNLENPQAPINGFTLDQILGGGGPVSYDASLTLSAFYRAVVIKSGVLSTLPYKLYKKTSTGRVEVKPSEHPVARMFSKKPNAKMTKTVFLEKAMGSYDIRGAHYGLIISNGVGRSEEIIYLPFEDVQVYETRGAIAYKIKGEHDAIPASRMIDVPNFERKSVLQKAQEDFELQMNTRNYGSKFFRGNGKPLGLFIPKGNVTNAQRADLINAYESAKNKNSDVALPQGWDYKELSVAPAEAEFLGTSQAGVANISRWTGVPLYKLADMSAATRNNVEQQAIEFLQDTMGPIGSKFENEHNTKLLTLPSEEDMYLEFNWDAYLKTDTITKAEAFSKYIQNGVKTPAEVRSLNNDPFIEGSDKLFIQGATVPIDLQEKVLIQPKAAPAARRNKRYSLPEIQKILEGKYGLSNEQLDMFANEKLNGNGKH
jgi:HK97 family phage portal protein